MDFLRGLKRDFTYAVRGILTRHRSPVVCLGAIFCFRDDSARKFWMVNDWTVQGNKRIIARRKGGIPAKVLRLCDRFVT